MQVPIVRDATVEDAPAIAAIYAPYVTGTTITFESTPPDAAEMAIRVAAAQRTHAFLVLEEDGIVTGYAYAVPYRPRPAYRWSCEVSVYLDPERRGAGRGRRLYAALLERVTARGYRMAVAGITQPNEASVRLHRALGFETVGTYGRIGWKLGQWRDVMRLQLPLGDPLPPGEEPPEPT